jgi:Ca2+/Na+ antiporter
MNITSSDYYFIIAATCSFVAAATEGKISMYSGLISLSCVVMATIKTCKINNFC